MGQRGPNAKPATARPGKPMAAARRSSRHRAPTRAGAVVEFVQSLWITSGALTGTKMVLRPWQADAIEEIYSADTPKRTALLSMGRKGGKTGFASALGLCALSGPEARRRGQVLVGASDRPQAKLTYDEIRAFALADADLSARLIFRDYSATVEDTLNGSLFRALSSDAAKAHGMSGSFVLADEIAQWKRGSGLMAALRTGMGAHSSPMLIALSTRSPDADNPFEELLSYWEDVKAGRVVDPEFYGAVYSAPLDLDPFSPEAWHAANPSMTEERFKDIEAQARQARRLPSQLPSFRAFVLNQPTETDERFISAQDWDACAGPAEPIGPCYGGLDLAGGASDLCAFSLYWPETRLLRSWAFMPAGRIDAKELEDRLPYRAWIAAGHLIATPGRAIDRIALGEWMASQTEGLELIVIAADRWMLVDLQQSLDREGITLPIEPFGQGFKDMSPAVGAFEALVMDARLRHGGNPLLRSAVASAAVEMDPAGNRKLSKLKSRSRIDPLVASVMAVGLAERQPAPASFEFTGMLI